MFRPILQGHPQGFFPKTQSSHKFDLNNSVGSSHENEANLTLFNYKYIDINISVLDSRLSSRSGRELRFSGVLGKEFSILTAQ